MKVTICSIPAQAGRETARAGGFFVPKIRAQCALAGLFASSSGMDQGQHGARP